MPPWQKWCKESVSCRQEGRGRSQKRLLEIYSIIDRNHVLIYVIKCKLISLLKIPNCIWLTPPTLSRTILLLLFSAIANQFADSANPKVVKAKGLLLKISITSSYSGRTRATWSWTWPVDRISRILRHVHQVHSFLCGSKHTVHRARHWTQGERGCLSTPYSLLRHSDKMSYTSDVSKLKQGLTLSFKMMY